MFKCHRDFEGDGNFSNTGLCPVCIKKTGLYPPAGGLLDHCRVVKTRIIRIVYKIIKSVRSSNESF